VTCLKNIPSVDVELDSRTIPRASGFMIFINLGVGSRAQYSPGQEEDPEPSEVMMILKSDPSMTYLVRWSPDRVLR
jgi:hypothetical protein